MPPHGNTPEKLEMTVQAVNTKSLVTGSRKLLKTSRHHTALIESGPLNGPLMIFVHGWPEIGSIWRNQFDYFAAEGWHCVAPDMRGYGGSSVPDRIASYAVRELVTDMVELHEALGGEPAIWIGHDWGCAVAWAMAAHYAQRCRGVINLCVPYFARGLALPNLTPLVDRELYPDGHYPLGQWDYWQFYRQHFKQAAHDFETDVEATLALLYRSGSKKDVGKPAFSAGITAQGGWFGKAGRAPMMSRDEALLSQVEFDELAACFRSTGFSGANSWYMNDELNLAYALEAPRFGRLTLPVLFLHAANDRVCDTMHSRLADPMRNDCSDLTEGFIDAGHELMLEAPAEVNQVIAGWLSSKRLS